VDASPQKRRGILNLSTEPQVSPSFDDGGGCCCCFGGMYSPGAMWSSHYVAPRMYHIRDISIQAGIHGSMYPLCIRKVINPWSDHGSVSQHPRPAVVHNVGLSRLLAISRSTAAGVCQHVQICFSRGHQGRLLTVCSMPCRRTPCLVCQPGTVISHDIGPAVSADTHFTTHPIHNLSLATRIYSRSASVISLQEAGTLEDALYTR
jgi:hypothetical protein